MRLLLEVEQVHLLAQLAMVALGRFLQPVEVRVELLSVEPAGAVDARQHRVLLVAAPIGPRHPRQLERLRIELAGRRQMRPAARSEEHTSELQSLMRISYAVFCLNKKTTKQN